MTLAALAGPFALVAAGATVLGAAFLILFVWLGLLSIGANNGLA